MTIHPQDNRANSPQGDSSSAEGAPRRKRSRRRKSSRVAARPAAPSAEPVLDADDDDDLSLPSYGMRFERKAACAASDAAANTARPAAARPPATRSAGRPQERTPASPPHAERSKRTSPPPPRPQSARPQTARPQASPPAGKPQARPPAPARRPVVEKPPIAEAQPVLERPPVAAAPAGEGKPSSAKPPRERPSRGRPPSENLLDEPEHSSPAAKQPRPAAPRNKAAHSTRFAALGLSEIMLDALVAACYEQPTPVQEGFIPRALQNVDVMGQAQTGTGKTAAFAIPILEMLQPQHRGAPPQALILVPTRELAVQVRDEIEKLSAGRTVSIVAVYGGKPIRKQIEQVNHGAAVIVGTPGRVLDLMSRGALMWSGLRVVVLDEADRMLDIGFRPDIEKILRRCPASRQTLLLSATLAPPVKRLAERYMRDPEVLDFSPKNLAVETIEQFYFTVEPERKFDLLVKLLEREDPKQAIVFCRTKRGTDKICTRLSRRYSHVDTIHGDLQQSSRDRVMKAFREGKLRWLVATDVVGRGIDVSGISHIINFDIPQFCDDYVHRVGRTGRMGREGVAYTFVTPEEGAELTRIEIRINRLLNRDEIAGFQAFDDPRAADSIVLGDGVAGMDDDLVESKPAPRPVFGKPVRRIRRAL